jgi:transketolase
MEQKTAACRRVIAETLFEIAKEDKSIVVLTTDARFSASVDIFAEQLPNQFIDVGIAEQNAVGIAAGLSKMGKKPFYFAPACFLSSRCIDQIRVDVVYSRSNVKLIGVSGGVSYGPLGYSHHALNDVAIMRTFPHMAVILPSDANQAKAVTKFLVEYVGPVYVRVGRNPVPIIYENEPDFRLGKSNTLLDGSDVAIIGTGETVYHCLEAGKLLRKKGISAMVIDMPAVKPLDKDLILDVSREISRIVVVEEHSVCGGLGSAIAELLAVQNPTPMEFIAFPDDFLITGWQEELFKYYGLHYDKLAERVITFLNKFRK